MVRVEDIRVANKSHIDWGKWEEGKMPPAAFPLSKRRGQSFRLGASYRWRLIRFEACGSAFRLLLAYNLRKEEYRATLALEGDRDNAVLASYEYHGTHPGWHVSVACDEIERVPQGVMVGPWQTRLPKARAYHRRLEFLVKDDGTALDVAAQFFRLYKADGVLL